VRYIGLGEMPAELIRRAHKIHPIAAVQMEYSLFSRDAENQIIPLCKELGIRFIACAPLCRGLLGGKIHSYDRLAPEDARRMLPRFTSENLGHNLKIVSELAKFAHSKSCTIAQLALAWLVCQSDTSVPLFGTTAIDHLQENLQSAHVKLMRTDIAAINYIPRGSPNLKLETTIICSLALFLFSIETSILSSAHELPSRFNTTRNSGMPIPL